MATTGPSPHRARWWATKDEIVVRLSVVRDFCVRCFSAVGMPQEKATFTVDGLLEKDMQGDHLRGVRHVPSYCRAMKDGAVDPNPTMKVLAETSATALVDGGSGFSYCVGYDAMRLCIEKARHHGIAMVGVREQLGKLAPYLKMALAERLISFGTIQGPPVIAPTGGAQPIIGNNPTGFAFPTGEMMPMVLDAAFSQSSVTPIFAAARDGQNVPVGLVLDKEGRPTTDPKAIASLESHQMNPPGHGFLSSQYGSFQGGGSLVPIGGYKGYAFALAFGLLTSVLTGPRTPIGNPERGWHYDRPGSLFVCIDPGVFGPMQEFEGAMDDFLQMVVASPRRRGAESIAYPGLVSGQASERHMKADTVPLTAQDLTMLQEYANGNGMTLAV